MGNPTGRTLDGAGTRPHRPTCALRRPKRDHLRSALVRTSTSVAAAWAAGHAAGHLALVAAVAAAGAAAWAGTGLWHLASGRPDVELRSEGVAVRGLWPRYVPWGQVQVVAIETGGRGAWNRGGRVTLDGVGRRGVVLPAGLADLDAAGVGALVVCWWQRAPGVRAPIRER